MACEPSVLGGRFQRQCHILVRVLEERGYAVQLRWVPASNRVQGFFVKMAYLQMRCSRHWRRSSYSATAVTHDDALLVGNRYHRLVEETAEKALLVATWLLIITKVYIARDTAPLASFRVLVLVVSISGSLSLSPLSLSHRFCFFDLACLYRTNF
jgi:hypothetical protein